jgi:hypothetical protein
MPRQPTANARPPAPSPFRASGRGRTLGPHEARRRRRPVRLAARLRSETDGGQRRQRRRDHHLDGPGRCGLVDADHRHQRADRDRGCLARVPRSQQHPQRRPVLLQGLLRLVLPRRPERPVVLSVPRAPPARRRAPAIHPATPPPAPPPPATPAPATPPPASRPAAPRRPRNATPTIRSSSATAAPTARSPTAPSTAATTACGSRPTPTPTPCASLTAHDFAFGCVRTGRRGPARVRQRTRHRLQPRRHRLLPGPHPPAELHPRQAGRHRLRRRLQGRRGRRRPARQRLLRAVSRLLAVRLLRPAQLPLIGPAPLIGPDCPDWP